MQLGSRIKPIIYIIVVFFTIAFNLLGTISGKYIGINIGALRIALFWSFILIITFIFRTFSWIFLHRRFQLSFIYPILSLNYLFSLFLGKFLFQEDITLKRLIGSLIIVLGVFVITMSKNKLESI